MRFIGLHWLLKDNSAIAIIDCVLQCCIHFRFFIKPSAPYILRDVLISTVLSAFPALCSLLFITLPWNAEVLEDYTLWMIMSLWCMNWVSGSGLVIISASWGVNHNAALLNILHKVPHPWSQISLLISVWPFLWDLYWCFWLHSFGMLPYFAVSSLGLLRFSFSLFCAKNTPNIK